MSPGDPLPYSRIPTGISSRFPARSTTSHETAFQKAGLESGHEGVDSCPAARLSQVFDDRGERSHRILESRPNLPVRAGLCHASLGDQRFRQEAAETRRPQHVSLDLLREENI